MRWKIKLKDYDNNIVYKKDKLNTNEFHPIKNMLTAGNADEDIDRVSDEIIQVRKML